MAHNSAWNCQRLLGRDDFLPPSLRPADGPAAAGEPTAEEVAANWDVLKGLVTAGRFR